jgi:sugar lactone lactonase YvrE
MGSSILLFSGCATPQLETGTEYAWRTLVGKPGGLGNVDGMGAAARFCQPSGVALDAAGNVYVADYYNYAIRKIAPDGTVTAFAGCVGESGNADGMGNAARFDRPLGLAADAGGNLYVADSGNHVIRKVTPDGVVSTFAGRACEQGSTDAVGREARFRTPTDVAVDASGNVYVADAYNHAVRKITPAGAVTTLAGKVELKGGVTVGGFADGKGTAARFRTPRGVAVDSAGNVYVADTENALLRKVLPDGTVKTLAGGVGNAGYANGTNAVARFSNPQGVTVDASGNIYVADTGNQVIRRVTAAGLVSTVTNGLARFPSPRAVAADKAGNLVVADNDSQTISRIAARGGVTVLAGRASTHGSAEGQGGAARFNRPCGIVVEHSKRLTVTDNFNHTLRTVTPDGVVTTLAGRAFSMGSADGKGDAARFFWPSGAAQDGAGNVYVADAGNHTIRKVSPEGVVTTLAGGAGTNGWADGTGGRARFAWPADVALDGAGNLLVADRANHVIRRVAPSGEVTTVAGGAGKAGRADGVGGSARFNNPSGVAVDAVGTVYVADTGNHTIRKITPGGEVTTLAGCAGMKGGADGQGSLARLNGPSDVTADAAGNVYVADRDNHLIRRVTPEGVVSTLGGLPNAMSAADGAGGSARFAQPSGVALDSDGSIYVADACNNRIAVGVPRVVGRSVIAPAHGASSGVAERTDPVSVPSDHYVWDVFAGEPGESGVDDGKGREARLGGPQGLALDFRDVLYVADSRKAAIRRITPEGVVTTLEVERGRLTAPLGIAVGRDGLVYVSDAAQVLWRVSPSGEVTKLAGAANQRGSADGAGNAARFSFVPGVAVDAAGQVVLADHNNGTLRRVSPEGGVTTLAGRAGQVGTVDGAGPAARFEHPVAVAFDSEGTLFVAAGNKIRKVTPAGAVTTLAEAEPFGRLDGIAVDRGGNVYAADRGRHVIWKVTPKGTVSKLDGSELAMGGAGWLVTGLAVDRAGSVYVSDSVRNCVLKGTPGVK